MTRRPLDPAARPYAYDLAGRVLAGAAWLRRVLPASPAAQTLAAIAEGAARQVRAECTREHDREVDAAVRAARVAGHVVAPPHDARPS